MKNPLLLIAPLVIVIAAFSSISLVNSAVGPILTLSPEPTLTYSPTPTAVATMTPNPTTTAIVSPTPNVVPATATPAAPSATPFATTNPGSQTACHRILTAADFPQTANYAPPYNVATGSGQLLIQMTCGTDGENVTAIVGTGNPQEYVYDKGYVFRDNQWHQLQLFRMDPSVQPVEPNWYANKISSSFQMASGKLAQESFFLAYICHWDQQRWKCGCRDAACTDSKWNVQVFQR